MASEEVQPSVSVLVQEHEVLLGYKENESLMTDLFYILVYTITCKSRYFVSAYNCGSKTNDLFIRWSIIELEDFPVN